LVEQGDKHKQWQNRAHFIAVAAHAMRRILVDYAPFPLGRKAAGRAPAASSHEVLVLAPERAAWGG